MNKMGNISIEKLDKLRSDLAKAKRIIKKYIDLDVIDCDAPPGESKELQKLKQRSFEILKK